MTNYIANLTIAIPVFNRIEYFSDALSSVINQTIKCRIIVVDNASLNNDFEKICRKNEIEYFKNQYNIGMFANWNKCMELAKTDFLMILGDDDILKPTFVESFSQTLELYPTLDVFYSDFYLLNTANGNSNVTNHSYRIPFGYYKTGQIHYEYAAKFGLGFPSISCVFRVSKMEKYYTDFHASNDWLSFYKKIGSMEIFGLSEKLLYYRKHNNSDTSNPDTIGNLFLSQAYILEKIILPELKNYNYFKIYKEIFRLLVCIKIFTSKNNLSEIFIGNNIYSRYLIEKKSSNLLIKLIFALPQNFLKSIYYFVKKITLK